MGLELCASDLTETPMLNLFPLRLHMGHLHIPYHVRVDKCDYSGITLERGAMWFGTFHLFN